VLPSDVFHMMGDKFAPWGSLDKSQIPVPQPTWGSIANLQVTLRQAIGAGESSVEENADWAQTRTASRLGSPLVV
jgi:hypothetical protein